ncbi:hypothetical protein CBS115989_1756 [Aspergillus niger]|nr:hypothetical protein CBS115989_1756 [Aspergillus niger]KAI2852811.1 hypothetical protein CBS11350_444 [Aspergillus niger]KAI2855998.1 hypothetical protein CBS12448_7095 [Aspergillus niger]KAI2858876.1 hypothetical protein CBS11232_2248 [Aspergillus niger]KAI2870005.1 hypothetical protein CBS115988_9661 [Aspergillus niger]
MDPGSPPAPAVCLDVPTPRLRFTDGSPWSPITTSWIWAVVVTITTSIAGYWPEKPQIPVALPFRSNLFISAGIDTVVRPPILVGRASVARELGSPAALSLDLTPRETRRSSSRASRRTTREPEAHPSNLSHSSYSLPPTPVTTSFEEQLPSAKRRKTQRSATVDEKTDSTQDSAQTPNQKGSGGPSQISNSVSRKRERGRKSALANGETVQPATPAPNPKQQSQSTLHNFLSRKPQDRRKSLATQNPSPNPTMSTSNVSNSPVMNPSASNGRKTRKSMPAKLNGVENSEKTSSVDSTTSVTSTPQQNAQGGKANKTPASSAASANNAKAAQTQEASTKLATPATQPRSTPRTTTARSRRAERKSRAMAVTQDSKSVQSTPVSAVNANSHKPVNSQVAARTSSRPQRSTRKTAATSASQAVDDGSLETPSAPKTPFSREVADSIESTPAFDSKAGYETMSGYDLDTPGYERSTPYGESFPFEYPADMYGNKFGLDGSNDGPGSPTASFSTTTSAARTSGRTRKPTIKAMESLESERRFRRNRAPSSMPESALKEVKGKAAVKKTRANKKASAKTTGTAQAFKAAVDGKWAAVANRLLDLAAAAVAPEFEPSSEAEGWLEELRKEYVKKSEEKKTETPTVQSEAEPVTEAASEAQPQAEIGVEGSSKPFSTSETHRWTDEDGFVFTGKKNKYGEELVLVGEGYSWFRPNNTYGDKLLPQPPIRLKSHEQFEKDRIFGYPPRMGERNLPQDNKMPFFFENVDEVKATIKAREEARKRGIAVDRMMPAAYIQTLIAQHDENAPKDGSGEAKETKETKEPTRKRRRGGEASETTQPTKRRRREPEPTPPAEPPKTLRIKLTLKGGAAGATRKRSHSEMEDQPAETKPTETKSQQERSSPSKILKLGLRRNYTQEMMKRTTPEDLAKGPPEPPKDKLEALNLAPLPGPPPRNYNTAPGGRPRRRAAAALIAEFQNHAEQRARRANARKRNVPSDKSDDPNSQPNGQPNGHSNGQPN